jgi:hypothetical protein
LALLAIFVTLAATGCRRRVEVEVPQEFEGGVVVSFEQANGATLDDTSRVPTYKVNFDGLLRVRSAMPTHIRPEIWSIATDGRRALLLGESAPPGSLRVYECVVRRGDGPDSISFIVARTGERDRWIEDLGRKLHRETF